MSESLFDNSFSGIDQDNRQIGSRSSGHHVSCVLDMSGRIGNDKFPLRSRKIPISNIDSDSLFAFCTKSVGQQSEIDIFISALTARLLHRLELIFKDRLRIIKKPTDQSAFAIIHTSGCTEPEQIHIQISIIHDEKEACKKTK